MMGEGKKWRMEGGLEGSHRVCKDRNIPISWGLGNLVSSLAWCLISRMVLGKSIGHIWKSVENLSVGTSEGPWVQPL